MLSVNPDENWCTALHLWFLYDFDQVLRISTSGNPMFFNLQSFLFYLYLLCETAANSSLWFEAFIWIHLDTHTSTLIFIRNWFSWYIYMHLRHAYITWGTLVAWTVKHIVQVKVTYHQVFILVNTSSNLL